MAADPSTAADDFVVVAPSLSLPKGGGAIRSMGETLAVNAAAGTASLSVPIPLSPGRSGFQPSLTLAYGSGNGNGPFGLGWSLSLPAVSRRTDRGLPRYQDARTDTAIDSDIFILSEMEDLVQALVQQGDAWAPVWRRAARAGNSYGVFSYRPRVEQGFARVERWLSESDPTDHFWRVITGDNVSSFYGLTPQSRIFDPADPARIFSWLLCETFDDKGNAATFVYKPEDGVGIDVATPYEVNRRNASPLPQRYLKRVRYGNRTPRIDGENLAARTNWLFELVVDYGEHDPTAPTSVETSSWPVRPDAFSSFRSTFDVRTYRLGRRFLMFHHFAEEFAGLADLLVHATELAHQQSPLATRVQSVSAVGYAPVAGGGLVERRMPPLMLGYSAATIDDTVHELDDESRRNLPIGLDGDRYQWIDLDSEGAPGILTESQGDWYYKPNQGDGKFGEVARVGPRPVPYSLEGGQALVDLDGAGRLDFVAYNGPLAGWHERRDFAGWSDRTPFTALPRIDWHGRDFRFIDLTGDGLPDVLVVGQTVFTWHESLGSNGFGPERVVQKVWDEEQGPRCVVSDPVEAIFLADMSGDGLTDLVRVRFDEVCYWPNQGYGRFGPKITLADAPLADRADLFSARRVIFADLDGTGPADMIYVGTAGIALYLNQSGNSFAAARIVADFPQTGDDTRLAVVDLMAKGTGCLVFSSPRAGDRPQPLRYIDLMSAGKPNLLTSVSNSMGAQSVVEYGASSAFYLEDKAQARPWVTKLPFPVQVVTRVEHQDMVSNTTLVSTYRYAHGCFDGVEREYRGFAMVEQRDAEMVGAEPGEAAFNLPPVVTRSWYHTGALRDAGPLEAYFRDPRNGEYFTQDSEAVFLPDNIVPGVLGYDELREAVRALKGRLLRQEIYAEDGTDRTTLPYSVAERNYAVRCLQPIGPNRHGVFFAYPSQSLDYHYERNTADPRISHQAVLRVDDYGNVLQSVAVSYARRVAAFDEQRVARAVLSELEITNPVLADDAHRLPAPAETRGFELTAPALTISRPLDFDVLAALAAAAAEIAFEASPTAGQTEKRLLDRTRTLYRKNDLSALLPLGQIESLALPGERYRLTLTPGLLDLFASKASRSDLTALLTSAEGGYRALDGGATLWAPSGRVYYSPNFGDAPPSELAAARANFFQAARFEDPFGNRTIATYDSKYALFVVMTEDAAGNRSMADYDFRVLQPVRITDPNGNRAEARFDALGLLVATALTGKATGAVAGDSFADFVTDLGLADVAALFAAPDPTALAVQHLGSATSRFVYALDRMPVGAVSIARETHVSDLAPGAASPVQLRVQWFDGFGRPAQTKMRAAPGPLDPTDPTSPTADPRWAATGTVVYNNKGKPVRQYEPYFSASAVFGIEQRGVSDTLFYDPPGRMIAVLHPDHSYEKTLFDPWRQDIWDRNDTLAQEPAADPDIGNLMAPLPAGDHAPGWYATRAGGALGPAEQDAAQKALVHSGTPGVSHFNPLGQVFLSIADNGPGPGGAAQLYSTLQTRDIQGRSRRVTDALGRIAATYDYDLAGKRLHQTSMEAGERWLLANATGAPLRAWNARNYRYRTEYDILRRPVRLYVQGGDPTEANPSLIPSEILAESTIFGDSVETGLTRAQQQSANLLGKVFSHRDAAGLSTTDLYDFKGNGLRTTRQFTADYRTAPDWSQNPALDSELYTGSATYDALNRPIVVTAADYSEYRPGFDRGGQLTRIDVAWRGGTSGAPATMLPFVTSVEYDAKGQRTRIRYANGAVTAYRYDAQTFRLVRLTTTRTPPSAGLVGRIFGDPATQLATQLFNAAGTIQDLTYTLDPQGNIVRIANSALQTVHNGNQKIEPVNLYTYDPLYRLVSASSREHAAQCGYNLVPSNGNYRDYPYVGYSQPNDLKALRNYVETYDYDGVGNFLKILHQAVGGNWTRSYVYNETSACEPTRNSNRLSRTMLQTTPAAPIEAYAFDEHGNVIRMPHLPLMQWNERDELVATTRQFTAGSAADKTWYVYDSGGQRVRKITERSTGNPRTERRYVGGFEVYREYSAAGAISLERQTLNVMDDRRRIALIETTTHGTGLFGSSAPLLHYQIGNNVDSACLELDADAALISYEEYSPYGATTFQVGRSAAEISLKRYRYTGKERDEENGFAYHGARYYAPWLGRWTACDPAGLIDGTNLYRAFRLNPLRFVDDDGNQSTPRPASGSEPPPPPPPPTPPVAGAHPEAVLAESRFANTWLNALRERYGGKDLAENLAKYQKDLGESSDQKAFATKEYSAVYKIFRRLVAADKELSKFEWEGVQIHHLSPKASGAAPEPARAVDPNNLLFTRGNARSAGTPHNAAQYGPTETHPNVNEQGPGGRQEWAASRGQSDPPQVRVRVATDAPAAPVPPAEVTPVEAAPGETVEVTAPGGGTSFVGGLASLLPAALMIVSQRSAQSRMDEAAQARALYKGMPTQDQVELQKSVGYEFSGRLDGAGRPVWNWKPTKWQSFRWNFIDLMSPGSELQPTGSGSGRADWT